MPVVAEDPEQRRRSLPKWVVFCLAALLVAGLFLSLLALLLFVAAKLGLITVGWHPVR
ncbi:MAG TPA: hypothetical protein VK689_03050 [Armatimonadota bacterium]|nr:hypothetical protein [Armatimonadota bacterium]